MMITLVISSACCMLLCAIILRQLPAAARRIISVARQLRRLAAISSTSSREGAHQLPPGPGLLGSIAILLGNLPHVSLSRLARAYGPIVYLRMGQIPCVVVSSPAMVRACFKDNDLVVAGRPTYAYGRILMYNCKGIGFAQYGPRYVRMRKLCTSNLFCAKEFEAFSKARVDETSSMIASIFLACQVDHHQQQQQQVSISQKVFTMAANNISHMVMGKRILPWTISAPSAAAQEFKCMINDFFWLVGVFNLGDYFPVLRPLDLQGYERKMKQLHRELDLFWERILREYQHEHIKEAAAGAAAAGPHFLDVLLSFTSATTPDVERFDRDDVKAALMDLFAAGTDTTAVAVEWAMAELIKNPHILTKAQQELDSVVGRNSTVAESHLPQLAYLQAIVKETLRLHPPAPLLGARETLDACHIAGYLIPKGTRVIVNEWSMGRDERVWDSPLSFLPERFSHGGAPGDCIDVRGHHFQLVPFGGGRRICMGLPLALCNVHLALASLIHSFDWSLAPHQALDMSEKFGTALPMANPPMLTPTPRLPIHLYNNIGGAPPHPSSTNCT